MIVEDNFQRTFKALGIWVCCSIRTQIIGFGVSGLTALIQHVGGDHREQWSPEGRVASQVLVPIDRDVFHSGRGSKSPAELLPVRHQEWFRKPRTDDILVRMFRRSAVERLRKQVDQQLSGLAQDFLELAALGGDVAGAVPPGDSSLVARMKQPRDANFNPGQGQRDSVRRGR